MQAINIYCEGQIVYTKDEGNGKEKRYIERNEHGIYILRRNETQGMGVLKDKRFHEDDLSLTELATESRETTNCGRT